MSATGSAPRPALAPGQTAPLRFHSLADRPELRERCRLLDALAFPAFMELSDLAPLWPAVYEGFPDWQLAACDPLTGEHLAHANAVPFVWDGAIASLPQTATEMLDRAVEHQRADRRPNALGALQVVVRPALQGRGLSTRVLQAVAALTAERGVTHLLAPIRPNRKARYPLAPFDGYVRRTRPDGLPADPWQRVHARLGAAFAAIVPGWLTVVAPVTAWEGWAERTFPESGQFAIPGALVPVAIDLERACGRYVEPHLWMHYRLAPAEGARR